MTTLSQVKKYICSDKIEQAIITIEGLENDEIKLGSIIKSSLLSEKGDAKYSNLLANEILDNENESNEAKFGAIVSKVNTLWRQAKYDQIPDLMQIGDSYLGYIEKNDIDLIQWLIAKYYNIKGNYFWDKGNLDKSNSNYLKSLEIATAIKNDIEIAKALNNLGIVHYRKGEYELALEKYEKNLEIKRKIASNIDVSAALSNIGTVYLDMGKLKDALVYFQDSIKSINRNGDSDLSGLAFRYVNIGFIHTLSGNLVEAVKYFEDAISIYKKIDNQFHLARTLGYLGQALFYQNNQNKAEIYLESSLKSLQRFENAFEISMVLHRLIIVKLELDLVSEALELLSIFNDLVKGNSNNIIEMRCLLAEAMISKKSPRLADKVRALNIFSQIIENRGMNELIKNEARVGLCEILLLEYEVVDNDEVRIEINTLIAQIYKYSQKEHAFPYLIRILEFKAKLYIKMSRIVDALKLLEIGEFYADERGLTLEKVRLQIVRDIIIQKSSAQKIFLSRFGEDARSQQNQEVLKYLEELSKINLDDSN